MKQRNHTKRCLLYPEQKLREIWDIIITVSLMIACISTPLDIAFAKTSNSFTDNLLSFGIDIIFAIDIIVQFNSAYYTQFMDIIDDRKEIIINYLKGWFVLDLLAIIPFDIIMEGTSVNGLARIARIGKFQKLFKLTRLLRIVKVFK